MNKVLVTLSGHSCSGKTYLENKMVDQGYTKIISTTTRPPRPFEVDGKDYHFISEEEFRSDLRDTKFFESEHVNGYLYGTTFKELKTKSADAGIGCVKILEAAGVRTYQNIFEDDFLDIYSEFFKHFTLFTVKVKTPYLTIRQRLIERTCAELLEKPPEDVLGTLINRVENIEKDTVKFDKIDWDLTVDGMDVYWAIESINYNVKKRLKEISK